MTKTQQALIETARNHLGLVSVTVEIKRGKVHGTQARDAADALVHAGVFIPVHGQRSRDQERRRTYVTSTYRLA